MLSLPLGADDRSLGALGEVPMSTGSAKPARGAAKAAPAASPTLRRWELAARLRELRLAAGKSVDEVAGELMCSAAKISRMETAGRGVQARDIRDLARYYKLPATVRDELMRIADESKQPGWWQRYRTLPEQTAYFVGLEASARQVRTVSASLIPGLLQTVDYTAALMEGVRIPGTLDEEQRREWIDVRQRRQQLLLQPGFELDCIVDESAITRFIGSAQIMIDQVTRLVSAAEMSSVNLRIVPFSRGAYPALEGPFQLMHFGENYISDLVYIEQLSGSYFLDKESEVEKYREVYEYIAEEVALDPKATRDWLVRHLSTLRSGA